MKFETEHQESRKDRYSIRGATTFESYVADDEKNMEELLEMKQKQKATKKNIYRKRHDAGREELGVIKNAIVEFGGRVKGPALLLATIRETPVAVSWDGDCR